MNVRLALIGDSIFDNGSYVLPGQMSLLDHVQSLLPAKSKATLFAKDGTIVSDVRKQISIIPDTASHIIMSAGGNDALGAMSIMSNPVTSIKEALSRLATIRRDFAADYRATLAKLSELKKPFAICTIYESVPGLPDELKTALSIFNDTITREGLALSIPIIDLRHVCVDHDDYSSISPIEPSELGGKKIASAIKSWLDRRSRHPLPEPRN